MQCYTNKGEINLNTYICKNCEQSFQGDFCNNCGQKYSVRRIDYKYFLDEVSNSLLQINRGFFYTLKELFVRPGKSISDFLNGKRKQHFKPLAYLLLTSTLYVLAAYFLGISTITEEFVSGYTIGISDADKNEISIVVEVSRWLAKNQAYTLLLIIPIFSFASYLSFFKSKYNYFEHLTLNIFITGQQMVIYLLLSFLVEKDDLTEIVPFVFGIFYNIWTLYQFFSIRNKVVKALLILLTYFIFIIQIAIILFSGIAMV